MLHAGMDLHKKYSVVTVIDDEGSVLVSGKRLDNDPNEVRGFFKGFDEEVSVVLEAGSNWYWMCDLLDGMGIGNKLSHPLKTKAIASAKIKNDKIDSRTLSHLSRMDFVPDSYKPDIATRHLREVLRCRAGLVNARTAAKNRVHALLGRLNIRYSFSDLFGKAGWRFLEQLELPEAYRRCLDVHLGQIQALNEDIKELEKDLDKIFSGSHEAQLLTTVPGIGPLIALTIIAEIVDIDRFPSADKLASYAGLAPSTSQSGKHTAHGRITKQGSRWLRWALVEAVMHTPNRRGPIRKHYLRVTARKGKKVARAAAARKLATYIYHMLKEDKDYMAIVAYLDR